MLRFTIFILLFNTICLADNKYNANKFSGDLIIKKRELPNIEHVEDKSKSVRKDLPNAFHQEHEQEESTTITNKVDGNENKNKTSTEINSDLTNDKSIPNSIKINNNEEHSKDPWAAVKRGFYVFLGLSIIIIIYFIVKSFRLRPGAAPPATVRKYGIVGRRSDMEMLPLPLVEEDDDDTVFDMGSQMNR